MTETTHDMLHRLMKRMDEADTVMLHKMRRNEWEAALRKAFRYGRLVAVDAPQQHNGPDRPQ